MGRKGSWFSSVKKALSPDSKEKQKQKAGRSKKKWLGKPNHTDANSSSVENITAPPPIPEPEEVKSAQAESEQSKHVYSVALATAAAAEAASEVVRFTSGSKFSGKSKEEVAAIKIQAAFRGYLARRALRALRGLIRLKSLIEGPAAIRQATNTLRCMQTVARVQFQVHSRRIRMIEENQALQKQLLHKHAKELESLQMGEDWDDSLQSKEKVEAKLLGKYEAAMRRERALAYAFSHQKAWRNSLRSVNPMFMDPRNPSWGWSWLERWMAPQQWESRSTTDKDLNDNSSIKSAGRSISRGEISKSYARYQRNANRLSPTSSQKPSHRTSYQSSPTPPSKTASVSSVGRTLKPASPRGNLWVADEDSKSMLSMQSEQYRKPSVVGSLVRDDESLASSLAVPSYMAPTQSAKAKSQLQSPLGFERNGTAEKGAVGPAKKRLSFPASPAKARRHSAPPKVDSSSIA